jgi:hypothetical protein
MAVATISMLALVSAPAAAAAIRYASPGGGATGAEPCLSSDPCSLSNAIEGHAPADVNNGDRVVVLGGMGAFNPAGQINISKQIDIGGAAGEPVPVINGAGARGLNGQTGGISLHDLRVDQATGSAAFSLENGSAERVFATYGGGTTGGACEVAESTVVRDSVCWATGSQGAGVVNGGGVVEAKLRNVTAVGSGTGGRGIRFDSTSSAAVEGVNVIAHGTASDVLAKTDNTVGPIASVTLTASDFASAPASGMGSSATPPGTNGNVIAPPLFADASAGDFHELAGSPTIDAGLAAAGIGALDLDSNPRAISAIPTCTEAQPGTPDMGAFEYIPSPLPTSFCSGPSNAFTYSLKGKKLIVSVQAAGTVAVSDPASHFAASTAKRKRRLLLKSSSAGGGPGVIVVRLRLSKLAKAILRKKHRVKVRATITFTPLGALANTQTAKLKIRTKHRSS